MNNTSQVASQWLLEDTQVQVVPASPMMFPPAGDDDDDVMLMMVMLMMVMTMMVMTIIFLLWMTLAMLLRWCLTFTGVWQTVGLL